LLVLFDLIGDGKTSILTLGLLLGLCFNAAFSGFLLPSGAFATLGYGIANGEFSAQNGSLARRCNVGLGGMWGYGAAIALLDRFLAEEVKSAALARRSISRRGRFN